MTKFQIFISTSFFRTNGSDKIEMGRDKIHINSLFSLSPLSTRVNFIRVDSGDNEKSEFICILSRPSKCSKFCDVTSYRSGSGSGYTIVFRPEPKFSFTTGTRTDPTNFTRTQAPVSVGSRVPGRFAGL